MAQQIQNSQTCILCTQLLSTLLPVQPTARLSPFPPASHGLISPEHPIGILFPRCAYAGNSKRVRVLFIRHGGEPYLYISSSAMNPEAVMTARFRDPA